MGIDIGKLVYRNIIRPITSVFPYVFPIVAVISVIAAVITGMVCLISATNESRRVDREKFIQDLRSIHPSGQIIFKHDNYICSINAKDIAEEQIPITEIKCSSTIQDIAYLGSMTVAWVGECHYNDSAQAKGALYLTDLRTKVSRQVLTSSDLSDEAYYSLGGTTYFRDLEKIVSCGNQIYLKTSVNHWYTLNPRDPHVVRVSGPLESGEVSQVSPDGLLKVRAFQNRGSLSVEMTNDGSRSRYFTLSGSDPMWVSDEK